MDPSSESAARRFLSQTGSPAVFSVERYPSASLIRLVCSVLISVTIFSASLPNVVDFLKVRRQLLIPFFIVGFGQTFSLRIPNVEDL